MLRVSELWRRWNGPCSFFVLGAVALGLGRAQNPVVIDPSGYALQFLVSGDTVHAFTWSSSTAPSTLRHTRSFDSGKTWPTAPLPIAPNTTDFGGAAIDGDTIVVSLATASGHALLRSLDGGTTWLAPTTLHVVHPGEQAVRLLLVQGALIAAWAEPRVGPGDIWANRSLDLGATWAPADTRLDLGAADQVSFLQSLVGDAQAVYAVYVDATSKYLTKTLDAGVTWDATARFVTNDVFAPAASGPVLLADFVGAIQRSADFGATWTPTPFPHHSGFAISGSEAVVASYGGPISITPMHSTDAGATWTQAGSLQQYISQWVGVSILGDTWCILDRFAMGCCFPDYFGFYVTTDHGATWRFPYWYAEFGWPVAMENGLLLALISGTFGGVTGPVQGAVYHGFHPYGPSTPGANGIDPELHRAGTPSPGQTLTVSIERALGGSPALIGASFAGPASQPIGNATILLALPVVSTWLFTNGAPGAPGAGQVSMQFTVPNSSAFYGFRMHFQGFVLDAASAVGFSATSGLETVFR